MRAIAELEAARRLKAQRKPRTSGLGGGADKARLGLGQESKRTLRSEHGVRCVVPTVLEIKWAAPKAAPSLARRGDPPASRTSDGWP